MPQAGIGRAVGAGRSGRDDELKEQGWLAVGAGGGRNMRQSKYRAMPSQPTEPALEVAAQEDCGIVRTQKLTSAAEAVMQMQRLRHG